MMFSLFGAFGLIEEPIDDNDAFRKLSGHSGSQLNSDLECGYKNSFNQLMNQPPKRGKYAQQSDELEQSSSTAQDGLKQCEYVSNRTRLRCKNQRTPDQFKDYGFCEEHHGYIERVKQEGFRTKYLFDPSFEPSESFLDLPSGDDDETLVPKYPEDFPFVYESMYCDSRVDNDENPLRSAKYFTRKEVVREYIRALERQRDSIQQLRTIYKEKQHRILQQIARLRNQSGLTRLNPLTDAKKIEKLLIMRRETLRQNKEKELLRCFSLFKSGSIKPCAEREIPKKLDTDFFVRILHPKRDGPPIWKEPDEKQFVPSLEQQPVPISRKRKKDADEMQFVQIINPQRDEPITRRRMMDLEGTQFVPVINSQRNEPVARKRKQDLDEDTQICARVNRPWDGKRKTPFITKGLNNNLNQPQKHQILLASQQPRMPAQGSSYQQYLSSRLVAPTATTTIRRRLTPAVHPQQHQHFQHPRQLVNNSISYGSASHLAGKHSTVANRTAPATHNQYHFRRPNR